MQTYSPLPKHGFAQMPDSENVILYLHDSWKFTREGIDRIPQNITVPSNWFLQSINEQPIDYNGKAWYEKKFVLSTNNNSSAFSYRLVFEGIDYEADIWLNGEYLGRHTGYFAPFHFDTKSLLRFGSDTNSLKICVNSPNETASDWSLHKRLIKGIFSHHDTRPGGAWSIRGQEQNTGGIWGKVYLTSERKMYINSIFSELKLSENNTEAQVSIQTNIVSQETSKQKVRLCRTIQPYNFSDSTAVYKDTLLISIENKEQSALQQIEIQNPHLWYTADIGKPNLYTITSTLIDSLNNIVYSRKDRIGLRTIYCDSITKQWFLNGRRIFLRGTNYIGTQWLSSMKKEDYERDINFMQEANINAVRVHAHISSKSLYNVCDEKGILVWQDFPLQWGYSDESSFFREAAKQTQEMITSLYNHPSIIAWCLHNEPPFDADWMKYKYKDYNPAQNQILNETLTKIAKREDSTRYIHPFSATREHHWQGWYGGTMDDHTKPTKTRIISEFGAQALPQKETLEKIFTKENLFPATEQQWELWEFHNFQRMETFQNAKVKQGSSLDEFIANTQDYQTRLTKLAAESYRKQKYNPVSSIFQFMFVENWASLNWGILDYRRVPKPAYFALKEAYKPTTVFAAFDSTSHSVILWVVNDQWKPFQNAEITCTIDQKPDTNVGSVPIKLQKSWKVTIPSDTSYIQDVWKLPSSILPQSFHKHYFLQASLQY
jgi:beta-mannosidase